MMGDPLVIGGTGGSGTRVVARILTRAGWFLGSRLNRSDDAMDIADFDWRWGTSYVRGGATDEMREEFEAALAAHLAALPDGADRWGWKHPHSYLLLPFLAERFSELRFIHVVRDGRDVAVGRNQNQLSLYGDAALGPGDPVDPVRSIAFWAWANDRAGDHCAALLRARSLCVRLEDLCLDPRATTRRVLAFAGAPDHAQLPVDEITPPASLGRGRRASPALVSRMEAAAAATLGRFGYLDASSRRCPTDQGFATFRALVLSHPELQERLRAEVGWPGFVDLATRLAAERGCSFTADELEHARHAARRAWLERGL